MPSLELCIKLDAFLSTLKVENYNQLYQVEEEHKEAFNLLSSNYPNFIKRFDGVYFFLTVLGGDFIKNGGFEAEFRNQHERQTKEDILRDINITALTEEIKSISSKTKFWDSTTRRNKTYINYIIGSIIVNVLFTLYLLYKALV